MYLIFGSFLCIICYALLISYSEASVAYAAVFLGAMGAFPVGPGFISWGVNNAAGASVRAVSAAYIVSVGTIGAIIATWTYLPEDGPRYRTGHSINLGAQAGISVISVIGVLYVQWENSLRARGGRDTRLVGKLEQEIRVLGDRHPSFRYMA